MSECGYAASRAKGKTSGEIVTNFGIGSVYAITLLFFASKGEYPIYDKYAHIGLASISSGGDPTDERFKISDNSYAKMFHTASRNEKGDITDTAIAKAWDDYMGYKRLLMGEDGESKGIFGNMVAEQEKGGTGSAEAMQDGDRTSPMNIDLDTVVPYAKEHFE